MLPGGILMGMGLLVLYGLGVLIYAIYEAQKSRHILIEP